MSEWKYHPECWTDHWVPECIHSYSICTPLLYFVLYWSARVSLVASVAGRCCQPLQLHWHNPKAFFRGLHIKYSDILVFRLTTIQDCQVPWVSVGISQVSRYDSPLKNTFLPSSELQLWKADCSVLICINNRYLHAMAMIHLKLCCKVVLLFAYLYPTEVVVKCMFLVT